MAKAEMNLKDLIGKRLRLVSNKVGILRYFGPVNFAPGNWCGIELDEPDGDNDGSINNICYFMCKEKHGMFCQVSEIAANLNLPEMDCYAIPSECTSLGIQKKDKCEDPDFSLNNIYCSETSSNEIPKNYYLDFYCKDSVVDIRLYKEKTSPTSFEKVDFDYDSDESLGILPLGALEDESESLNDAYFDIAVLRSFPFLKNYSEPGCFDNQNVITENAFNTSDSLTEHTTPALNKETIHSFEELDKLNITRVLQLPEEQDNLNITQTLSSPVVQNDLNETLFLHNHTFEVEELKEVEKNAYTDDLSSPACIAPKMFPDLKSDESSAHKTSSSPKYASTPKHEANYTFILDEEFLNSEKGVSPVVHFNKTIIKDNVIKKKTVFPESGELDNENILSMPNIDKPLDFQCALNKTFNNVYSDTKYLPSVEAALNTTVTFPEVLDKTFELKVNGTYEITASDSCDVKHNNVLNTTVSLSKEFEMFNLEQRLDCNTKVSDSCLEKNTDYGDFKDISENTLNTHPIPKVLEKGVEKEKSMYDKTQILNTTFEEKLDQLAELPQFMKASQVQKDTIKETRIAQLSQIARKVDNSSAATSSSKFTEFDKKKTRKSVFSSRSNSTDALNKQNSNRRKTFGSISSQSDDNIVSSQKLSRCAQKQYFSSHTTSDSQSLKAEATLCNISKTYPIKRSTPSPVNRNTATPVKRNFAIQAVKNNHAFRKSSAEISSHVSSSMHDTSTREAKSSVGKVFKNVQLNETINLTHSMPDAKNTSFKKPKIPYKKSFPKPEAPRIPKPEAPRIPKPEAPRIPKPEAPRIPKPEAPRIPKPEAVRIPKPEAVRIPKPEAVRIPKPEAVRIPKPEAVRIPKPEAVRIPKPEAVRIPKPEAVRIPKPEAVRIPKPEAVRIPKPEAVRIPKPEAVRIPKPEAVRIPKPEAVRIPKPEVPRIPQPSAVSRKSSLPILRQSSSTVRNEEHNMSLSGASEKKVLSLRNISDIRGDPQSSYENRRQSLSIKDALFDPTVKKLGPVSSSQDKKKDIKDVPSVTSHNRPSFSHSNIPGPVSKTKGPEDRTSSWNIPSQTFEESFEEALHEEDLYE